VIFEKSKMISESFASGKIIREPVGFESGYWVGAPGVFFAADERAWYLTYRIRRPRGVAPDRGGEARIARSTDLQNWEDVWSVTKDKFDSASIERSAIQKCKDGQWRYFTSYVDPADGRWCVSCLKSNNLRKLDPAQVNPLFKAASLELEGIKDPWILAHDRAFYMFLSVALRTPQTSQQSHSSLDIYNTGECLSATGLAISLDLENWEWQGVVFKPRGTGWDCYCRRINSVVPYNQKFIAFYDGSASHAENYEEKTGVAVSSDLRRWECLTPTGPILTSPHCSGSLRYIDAQPTNGPRNVTCSALNIFYEFARPDSAHDLRLASVPIESLLEAQNRVL
jgi:hypothetical protein